MPFIKQPNILYLHVPKTGGMSIEEYFFTKYSVEKNEKSVYGWYLDRPNRVRVSAERSLQHFTYEEILENNTYFNIDFSLNPQIIMSVRNPLDRMVSEMFWNQRITVDSTPEQVADAIHTFLYIDTEIRDNHKLPQYQFGLDEHGIWMENIHIVRTESLEKDMKSLGYDDFHVHHNKCKSGICLDYKKYLNHRSIQMIQEYYAKDFERFGYSKYSHYNATIVTAFVQKVNRNAKRSIEDYIEFGKKLLNVPNPKVVYIDRDSYRDFFEERELEFPLTTFIPIRKEDIYLYNYKDQLTEFDIQGNPEKDTIDYLFVQCNKTEWVVNAIDRNIYKTDQYLWIDFGIYHMVQNTEPEPFEQWVLKMTTKNYPQVRIASCKYKGYSVNYNVYRIETWTFAGSVFGGNVASLLEFAYLTKKEILQTIQTKKSIMWEINIWYLIYRKNLPFFDMYTCGHDFRILDLY